MTKSRGSGTISAFATLRVIGDDLDPRAIAKAVHVAPTLVHRKGERVASKDGRSFRTAKFGMWYLSTRTLVASSNLDDHLQFLATNVLLEAEPSTRSMLHISSGPEQLPTPLVLLRANQRLEALVREQSLSLVVTAFWRGRSNGKPPTIPKEFEILLRSYAGRLELDFATEELEQTRRANV